MNLQSKRIGTQKVFFALLSGLLLFLSFPKFGLGIIAWIAFVPLFIALKDDLSLRQAAWLGFISGITAHIGMIYWIADVVIHYGHLPFYRSMMVMFLLASYLSIYVALFSSAIVFLRQRFALYLVAPVSWICLEYLKSNLFTGFPWENLGYSQYADYYFIQIADVAGVYGLSFLVMLINVTIYEVLTKRFKDTLALSITVLLLCLGGYLYGILRTSQIDQVQENAPTIEIALVQGNIDQSIKWNPKYQKDTLDVYENLSPRHPDGKERLLVWPETAVPFDFQDESDLKKRVESIAVRSESWFIFGSMSYELKGGVKNYYNSAYLLSPAGRVHGKYDKVHLVPYGEYVPLRRIFPSITALAADIGDFLPGREYIPLKMGKRHIGVLICYEGILSEAARRYKRASADFLVNITNDAWFGTTSAPYQHFSMTLFRAIETRLFLARAANTGISAIVDPTGRIVRKTELFKKDKISASIKIVKVSTIYANYGDWLTFMAYTALIVMIAMVKRRRMKNES